MCLVVLSLYVGVAVFIFPQDGLRLRFLFGIAMFFGVCFDVQYSFFSTRDTWLYVEIAFLCVWKHVEFTLQACVFWPQKLQGQLAMADDRFLARRSLHLGVPVLISPKDGLRLRLLFATALHFNACYGVRKSIFSTCPVGSMQKPLPCGCECTYRLFFLHKNNKTAGTSAKPTAHTKNHAKQFFLFTVEPAQ